MEEYNESIDFGEMSEEELDKVAGGIWSPFHDFPPGVNPTEKGNCPQCGTLNNVQVFSWGQTGADGKYYPNAWTRKYKCSNCGNTWANGVVAGEVD